MTYGNLPTLQTLAIPTRPAPQPPVDAASFGTSIRDAYGIINANLRGAWTVLAGLTSAAGSMGFATLGPDGKLSISQRFEQAWTDVSGRPTTLSLTGDATGTVPFGAGTMSVSVGLADTGVTAGTYSFPRIVVDAKGRVISASAGSIPSANVNLIGDILASGQTGSPINAGLAVILPSNPLPFSVFGTYAQVIVDTTGRVRGGVLAQNAAGTDTLQDVTGRGATTPFSLVFSNAASSTSPTSGALVVVGGVGVGGGLNVAGAIRSGNAVVWTENSMTGGTGSGLMVRTAANAFTPRALSAGAGISITNADGVTANPTISFSRGIGDSLPDSLLDRTAGDGRYLRLIGGTLSGNLTVTSGIIGNSTLNVAATALIGNRLRVGRDGANFFWITTREGHNVGGDDAASTAIGVGSSPSTGFPTHIILRPGDTASPNIVCRPGNTFFGVGGGSAISAVADSPIQHQAEGACFRHATGGFDIFSSGCPMNLGSSGSTLLSFYYQNGYGVGNARGIGSVMVNPDGFSVTYGSASDYRLKTEVVPLLNAMGAVRLLNPVSFKFIGHDVYQPGFIAHEVQQVIPTAVAGERDAVTDEGKIKPQQLDPSKLVATLTAAIKELDAENTALKALVAAMETRLAALEAKAT